MLGTLLRRCGPRRSVDRTHVVLVTGCDSGLGYNIALRCHRLNMFVVAACYDLQSEGVQQLRAQLDPAASRLVALDLRNESSIAALRSQLQQMLADSAELRLSAVVNNAGQMVFGEFEWQTGEQIAQQIGVNLLGTMALTQAVLPLCRQHKARVITVTSHCAVAALPGLGPYAASKAGLRFFCDSLRVEQRKYGVDIIQYVPGSFVMSSNIAVAQPQHAVAQQAALDAEQLAFYGDYFQRYHKYLGQIARKRPVRAFDAQSGDEGMMGWFEAALLDSRPRAEYKYEPSWRYQIYHALFVWTPVPVRDFLVGWFIGRTLCPTTIGSTK